MKKTYIKPAFQAIELKARGALLAGSALGVGSGTLNADEALSPGGFFDEEDDY